MPHAATTMTIAMTIASSDAVVTAAPIDRYMALLLDRRDGPY